MSTDDDTVDDDVSEDEDPAEFEAALEQVRQRATAAKIPIEEIDEDYGRYIELKLQNGRDQRSLFCSSLDSIKQLLKFSFEKFVFLGPYEAICSYSGGRIEAMVRTLSRHSLTHFLERDANRDTIPLEAKVEALSNELTVSIGDSSDELCRLVESRKTQLYSIRITGCSLSHHDQALALLEKVANAVFLQFDIRFGIALSLSRARTKWHRPRSSARQSDMSLSPIKAEYDNEVMSLYWYGRGAAGMPLLQYLAYYQILEFYFPIYAQQDAHRRVKNILKSPTFDVHSDNDVSRIVTAVKGVAGRSFADERSQLRATIQHCVNASDLFTFLNADDERKQFLSKSKILKAHKLPLDSKEADICTDVAARIYDIRCMIVHSKNTDSEAEPSILLPFSKEAGELECDLELLLFVVREVLAAASKPLRT